MSAPAPLFDAALAAFMEGGVSITAGACSNAGIPTQCRGLACRISPDRTRVTIFVASAQAAALLDAVRENRAIAVVFSQPSTHRTVQLKGSDAAIAPMESEDWPLLEEHREAFAAELTPIGFRREGVRTLLSCPQGDVAAIAFTPSGAFSQTPGPKAGEPLRGAA